MRSLDRYLLTTIIASTLLVLLVLGVVFSVFALLGEIDDVGENRYGLGALFVYLLLTLPRRLYELFPSAALIGSLTGLGTLALHSELIAMRAAGISVGRIALLAFNASLVLGILVLLLGEFVVPISEDVAQRGRAEALSGRPHAGEQAGYWGRDQRTYVNIGRVDGRKRIFDITIYEFDEQRRLRVVTQAERGFYSDGGWLLVNLQQTQLGETRARPAQLQQAHWKSLLGPEAVSAKIVEPERMSILGLLRHNRLLEQNGQRSDRFLLAYWNKLVQPFTTVAMVLLALPFCFSSLRSASLGQRVFVGVLLGLAFDIINKGFGSFGLAMQLPPLLGALLPTMLFLALSLVLLRRVGRT